MDYLTPIDQAIIAWKTAHPIASIIIVIIAGIAAIIFAYAAWKNDSACEAAKSASNRFYMHKKQREFYNL